MIIQNLMFRQEGAPGETIRNGIPLRDNPESIIIGKKETLVLRIFNERNDLVKNPLWDEIKAWRFVIADDWKSSTPILYLSHDVHTDSENGTITIGLDNTRTQPLVERLANNEHLALGCELSGYTNDSCEQATCVYQWNIRVRNRRDDGTTPPPPDYTPNGYFLRDIATGEKYKLQIWNGILQTMKVVENE